MLDLYEYWNRRALYYKDGDVLGRTVLKTFIDRIKPKSLIEIGCGNGILFKLYGDVPLVSGCDWSPNMLTRAQNRCLRHDYKVNLFSHDITDSAPEGHWQLAVTRTCLMHIPPDKIEAAVANIHKICDEALIFEYWELHYPKEMAPHNWLHDYMLLFTDAGFKLHDSYARGDIPQVLFWFKKEVTKNG